MREKTSKYIFKVLVLALAVILVIMGVDIEIKLNRLSSAIPVAVYENTTAVKELPSSDYTEDIDGDTTVSASVTESACFENTASQTNDALVTDKIEQTSKASVSESTATTGVINTTGEDFSLSAEKEETTENRTEVSVADTEQIYYVTKSGTKYHIGSCSYLSKSKIAITVNEISSGGYEPCSRCIK